MIPTQTRLCPLPLLRQGVLRFAFRRRELFSARPSQTKLEGPRVDSGMREAERCTDVTNAVFGEADGAAVLAELTPPLMVGGQRFVRLGWAVGLRTGELRQGKIHRG